MAGAAVIALMAVVTTSCSLVVDDDVRAAGSAGNSAPSTSSPSGPGNPGRSPLTTAVPPEGEIDPEPGGPPPGPETPTVPDPTEQPGTPAGPVMPHIEPAVGRSLVDTLVVSDPPADLPPYRRALFGDGWDYDHVSKCNTRERVLIEESIVPPSVDSSCRSTNGSWISFYDGLHTNDPADLQIDHFIPLSNAWRSGAWAWTDEQRRSFANDLDNPHALVAVSGTSNQSKGDRSPDQWLPPDRSVWCAYSSNWVERKAAWGLSVTPNEKATLVQVLQGC